MRELDVSDKEATAKQKQAESLTGLSQVIEKVADAQTKTAENNEELRIFLRTAMREQESFNRRLNVLEEAVGMRKGSGNVKDSRTTLS